MPFRKKEVFYRHDFWLEAQKEQYEDNQRAGKGCSKTVSQSPREIGVKFCADPALMGFWAKKPPEVHSIHDP